MRQIKVIEAYETSDKTIWTDLNLAEQHQKHLDLKSRISYFADKYGSYTDGKEDLYNILIDNIEELKEILQDE